MQQEQARISRVEWINLLALAFAQFINILDFMIVMPLGPRYRLQFEMSPERFGHMVASYGFAACIGGLFAAGFIDRFDRKKALLFTFSVLIVSTLLCALASGYTQLLMARSLAGVAGGIAGSLVMTIVSDLVPEHRRGFAIGIVGVAFPIASILGVPIGLLIADATNSVRTPFIVISVAGLIALFVMATCLPSIASGNVSQLTFLQRLKDQWSIASHRTAYLFMTMLVFGTFTIAPYIATYMASNVGLKPDQIKFIYIFGGLASLIAMPIFGKLSDRLGKRTLFLVVGSLAIIPTLWITNMPASSVLIAVTATTFFMALTSGRMVPAQALIAAATTPQRRAGFMSMISATQHLASGLAASLTAAIIKGEANEPMQNYSIAGMIAASSIVFSLICAVYLSQSASSTPVAQEPLLEA
jgi:predicted MFS family arabinose efflux permease